MACFVVRGEEAFWPIDWPVCGRFGRRVGIGLVVGDNRVNGGVDVLVDYLPPLPRVCLQRSSRILSEGA